MKYQNSLNAILLIITMLFTTHCSDKSETGVSPEKETAITGEQAVKVLIQVIHEAGLAFPALDEQSRYIPANGKVHQSGMDLMPSDYLDIGTNTAGSIEIQLWLGQEGHIIPKPEWQAAHANVCEGQDRYMRAARKLLEFTIFPSDKSVQINLIAVETGEIEASVFGEPLSDPNWLPEAMRDAWSKMQAKTTIKGAAGPCGDWKKLQITFSSEFTMSDGGTEISFEHVEANFALTFDADKNLYMGVGDFEWLTFTDQTIINAGGSCGMPAAQLKVVKLTTPQIAESANSVPVMIMLSSDAYATCSIAGAEQPTQSVSKLLYLGWPGLYERTPVQNEFAGFIVPDWEVSDTPGVIMHKLIERSKTDGNITITEKTRIEIGTID